MSKVRWFFQKHNGVFEPRPMEAAGWHVFSNYLAARALDPAPNLTSWQEFTGNLSTNQTGQVEFTLDPQSPSQTLFPHARAK